jgi:hypothetical protein
MVDGCSSAAIVVSSISSDINSSSGICSICSSGGSGGHWRARCCAAEKLAALEQELQAVSSKEKLQRTQSVLLQQELGGLQAALSQAATDKVSHPSSGSSAAKSCAGMVYAVPGCAGKGCVGDI